MPQSGEVFIHPSSSVSPGAGVGPGTRIWQHCTVQDGAEIGAGCLLSQNVYMEGGAVLGDRVKVKNNVCLYAGVRVEDGAFIGPCAVFTNVRTPRSLWPRKDQFLPTLVREGATIGANATLVCGVTVGRFALVGAGSVVTRDLPDFALAYGVPARVRGYVCRCGELQVRPDREGAHACARCGGEYVLQGGAFSETSPGREPGP